jgi:type VI secretion system secreted protein VgrG
MFIPRIGQEVIVDFLEGDPDQPVITGRVYNAEQMPPYELPGQRTKSGFRTDSSKGGGGYNELCFEDKKGAEQIIIHAQKDFNETVEHNHSTTVKVDQANTVQGSQTETVTKDQTITVSQGARSITVSTGNQSTTISTGHCSTSVAQSYSVTAGSDVNIQSTKATLSASAKKNVTIQSIDESLYLLAPKEAQLNGKTKVGIYSKEIEISASDKITIKVGGSSIVLDPSGIETKAAKITSSANGDHVVKGALVKIN